MQTGSCPPWYQQVAKRAVILWPLKAMGTMAFMALFFWGYFAVMKYPLSEPMVMPLIGADQWISFSAYAFPAYVSLWVYVSLPPAFQRNLRLLVIFGVWITALCLFCLGIFWIFPTVVPVSEIDWSLYPEMAFIKSVDVSGNACPSLHVASAIFSALWLRAILNAIKAPTWLHSFNVVFCLAIIWSTVATRQHVVLDVLGGLLVGTFFALMGLYHAKRADPKGL